METNKILTGHALDLARQLPDNSISMIATSPPYFGLREYGTTPVYWPEISFVPVAGLPEITIPEQEASLGLESSSWAYVGHLIAIFRELRRVLHPTGTLWLNLGDSYFTSTFRGVQNDFSSSGLKSDGRPESSRLSSLANAKSVRVNRPDIKYQSKEFKVKDLMMIPSRVALALQADDWYLRSDIIWSKVNGMPESVQDRPTKSHEHIFLFSKSPHYYYDALAISEPIKESSKAKLGRGIGGSHKNINGAPGQTPHSMNQPRLNVKFGGSKADGYGTRIHSGNDWQPPEEGAMANRRSVWSIATQNYTGSHYAAWPEKLVELMILAGCPEQVCPECGGPWVRITESKKFSNEKLSDRNKMQSPGVFARGGNQANFGRVGDYTSVTIGFRPTCDHNLAPIPGIVLDPFMGSGTTARVAIAHRRHYLGFELNERYVQELAPDRLNGVQIRFR